MKEVASSVETILIILRYSKGDSLAIYLLQELLNSIKDKE